MLLFINPEALRFLAARRIMTRRQAPPVMHVAVPHYLKATIGQHRRFITD